MVDFEIGQGDTLPILEFTLLQDGSPVSLAGCTLQFHMEKDDVLVLDEAAEIVVAGDGTGKYEWQSGDTDIAGAHWREIEVTFPGGGKLTWPRKKPKISIMIYEQIG